MNLGIDRARLGDIVVDGKTAVVFAKEEITEYIAELLFRIRHTEVRTVVKDASDINYNPKYEEIKGNRSVYSSGHCTFHRLSAFKKQSHSIY